MLDNKGRAMVDCLIALSDGANAERISTAKRCVCEDMLFLAEQLRCFIPVAVTYAELLLEQQRRWDPYEAFEQGRAARAKGVPFEDGKYAYLRAVSRRPDYMAAEELIQLYYGWLHKLLDKKLSLGFLRKDIAASLGCVGREITVFYDLGYGLQV